VPTDGIEMVTGGRSILKALGIPVLLPLGISSTAFNKIREILAHECGEFEPFT
jgi:hypothetical protein